MRIVACGLLLALVAGCATDSTAPSASDAPVAVPGAVAIPASTAPVDPALSGTWTPVLAELGGREFKFGQDFRLEVKGDRYVLYGAPQGTDRGRLVFVPGDPKAFDVYGEEGPARGKRYPVIYRVVGQGTLEACYDLDGKERPAAFITFEGTNLFRVIYKRR